MNSFTDYYAILGIQASASPEEIKAAFKKLALQYHPDVYKGADANERMSSLLQAYQTLNDREAKRRYDALRVEHFGSSAFPGVTTESDSDGERRNTEQHRYTSSSTVRSHSFGKDEITPQARRDRYRHYAFPEFFANRSMYVNLVDFAYTLTAEEAAQLVQDGLLRGIAAETKQRHYYCHRCHYRWMENAVRKGKLFPPRFCPQCHALDWPEYLLLHCKHCRAVFESEQIRYEIGSVAYRQGNVMKEGVLCPPYELFPLCPYCGRAHWSSAEDARVKELRMRAARRAAWQRIAWLGIAMVTLVVIGIVALGLWR